MPPATRAVVVDGRTLLVGRFPRAAKLCKKIGIGPNQGGKCQTSAKESYRASRVSDALRAQFP